MFKGKSFLFHKIISRGTLISNYHIENRPFYTLTMADKFVEHESKRCSKRKRALTHYRKKNTDAKVPKLGHDDINITDYYFENGLRKVYPYFHNFSTYVKGRWIGRTIADIFSQEFKGVQNLEEEIRNGMLTVNGKSVTMDFKLKNHQFLEHKMHRHENPVVATPLEIIADTPDLLVINKPSSLPVHPCGRYRFNSLTMLLEKEYGYRNLRTLYRLDRLTSGVLLLPKTTAKSVVMEKQLANKELMKEYVCRVEGEFPEGTIECKEPIGVISVPYSVSAVRPGGKECHTTFSRVSYNGRSSVVKCIPRSGRTHQIRVHLQFLGYPILNDPIYNSTAFGPQKAKGGVIDKSIEELENLLSRHHNTSEWILGENPEYKKTFDSNDTSDSSSVCDNSYTTTDTLQMNTCLGISAGDISDSDKATVSGSKVVSVSERTGDSASEISAVDKDKTSSGDLSSVDTESIKSSNGKQKCLSSDKPSADENQSESVDDLVIQTAKDDKHASIPVGSVESLQEISGDHTESVSVSGTNQNPRPSDNWEEYVASKQFDKSRYELEKVCHVCKNLYREPVSKELILFLHAVRYKGPDWEYSTELPDWSKDNWAEEDQYKLKWQT